MATEEALDVKADVWNPRGRSSMERLVPTAGLSRRSRLSVLCGSAGALLALGLARAGAATHSGDIVLDGVTNVVVAAGSTETWSGVVSGDGRIVLQGGGTLELSNGANTFAGGIEIQSGVVKALAEGCLGTGDLVTSGDGSPRQFWFAADGAYANAFRLGGRGCDESWKDTPSVLVTATVVFDGPVEAASDQFFRIATDSDDYGKWSARFRKPVNAAGQSLYLQTWGDFLFEQALACDSLSIGERWSCKGLVHLYSPGNAIGAVRICSGSVECHADGALGGARLYIQQNWRDSKRNRVNLNGSRQTAQSLDFRLEMPADTFPDTDGYTGAEGGSRIESQGAAARLTLTGEATDRSAMHMIDDRVELELDATEFPAFTQTLRYRQHGTCRPLRVLAGTLALTNGSTFAAVPELYIGEGGTVRIDESANAFAVVTNVTVNGVFDASPSGLRQLPKVIDSLTIGPNGLLKTKDGLTIAVREITIGGETYTSGMFDATSHPGRIEGVSLIAIGKGKVARWIAGGADAKLSTAENWDVSDPDLTRYATDALFAINGVRADVDIDAAFASVALSAPEGGDSFTFADAGGSIGILGGLAAEPAADDAPRRFTFEPEVRLADAQDWVLRTNDTVALKRGFSTVNGGSVELRHGTYLWSGSNTVSDAVTVTGGTLVVSGRIATPDHEWAGEVNQNGKGRQLNLYQAEWQKSPVTFRDIDSVMVLSNAHIECGVNMKCGIGTTPVRVRAGTTNEISGHFLHGRDGWGGIYTESGSELILSGGFANCYAATRMAGSGTIRFRSRPARVTFSLGFNPMGGNFVFEAPNNTFSYFALGYYQRDVCSAEFTVSDAMTNGTLVVGSEYSGGSFRRSIAGGGHLELNATTQRVERIAVFERGTVHGSAGSLVRVYGAQGLATHDASGEETGDLKAEWQFIEGEIGGGVGLEMCGTGTLTLTNRAFASSGDIIVTSGTIDFAGGATWLNGTNVIVRGTGLLRLGQKTFGSQAKLRLADGGRLSLASGIVQRLSECWVGDERVSGGTYTRETAPAALKAHLDESFAGTISIRSGFRAIVR